MINHGDTDSLTGGPRPTTEAERVELHKASVKRWTSDEDKVIRRPRPPVIEPVDLTYRPSRKTVLAMLAFWITVAAIAIIAAIASM